MSGLMSLEPTKPRSASCPPVIPPQKLQLSRKPQRDALLSRPRLTPLPADRFLAVCLLTSDPILQGIRLLRAQCR